MARPARAWPPAGALLLALAACMPPAWGANAVLHPRRTAPPAPPALPHGDLDLQGDGIRLRGWLFPAAAPARGVVAVYLHGIGDDRASGTWLAARLTRLGFDVLAYDGRAHGQSGGDACSYGVLERHDLSRALDRVGARRAVLVGVSLGAAVALQAAAHDPRIEAVVAVATFESLESVARDRAPWFASGAQVREALRLVEAEGGFAVADASPLAAAPAVRVPVLLVHGADDVETRPRHSERVFAALGGPKRLLLVPGAGHGDAFGRAWPEVEAWLAAVAPAR